MDMGNAHAHANANGNGDATSLVVRVTQRVSFTSRFSTSCYRPLHLPSTSKSLPSTSAFHFGISPGGMLVRHEHSHNSHWLGDRLFLPRRDQLAVAATEPAHQHDRRGPLLMGSCDDCHSLKSATLVLFFKRILLFLLPVVAFGGQFFFSTATIPQQYRSSKSRPIYQLRSARNSDKLWISG